MLHAWWNPKALAHQQLWGDFKTGKLWDRRRSLQAIAQYIFLCVIANQMLRRSIDNNAHCFLYKPALFKVVRRCERSDQGPFTVALNGRVLPHVSVNIFTIIVSVVELVLLEETSFVGVGLPVLQLSINEEVAQDTGRTPDKSIRPSFDACFNVC